MLEYAHVTFTVHPKGSVYPDRPRRDWYVTNSLDDEPDKMVDGLQTLFSDHDYFVFPARPEEVFDSYRGYDPKEFAVRDESEKAWKLTENIFAISFEILHMGAVPSFEESASDGYWSPTEYECDNGDRSEHFEQNFLEPILTKCLPLVALQELVPWDGRSARGKKILTREISFIMKFRSTIETSRDWESGLEEIDAVYSEEFEFIGI